MKLEIGRRIIVHFSWREPTYRIEGGRGGPGGDGGGTGGKGGAVEVHYHEGEWIPTRPSLATIQC